MARVAQIRTSFEESDLGKHGTGYWLTESLVLTARHVVQDPGKKVSSVGVHFDPTRDKTVRSFVASRESLWRSQSHDIALIAVETDLDPLPPPAFQTVVPGKGAVRFTSRGWIQQGERTRYTDFDGEALPFQPGELCTIRVNAEPEKGQDWRGISGAPIFIYGRLLAVVVQLEPGFSGRKVRAIPTAAFSSDPGFLEHFKGSVVSTAEYQRLLTEVTGDLKGSPTIWTGLDSELRKLGHPGLSGSIEATVEGTSLPQLVIALRRTQQDLLKRRRIDEATAVQRIAVRLLPALCLRTLLGRAYFGAEELPVHSEPMAEATRALFEGRACEFEETSRPQDPPRARFALRPNLETGIDPEGTQALADTALAFWDNAKHHPRQHLETWTRDHLSGMLPRGMTSRMRRGLPASQFLEELLHRLDTHFQNQIADQAPAFYLLADVDTAKECAAFLDRVRSELPALAINLTKSDYAGYAREQDELDPFYRLLHDAQK